MPNPFHYGSPAEGEYFVGRDEEIDTLVSRIRAGVSVVIISPRRYGKTSLHRAAQALLAHDRPPAAVIEVNVLRATSLAALGTMLISGAYRLRGARWARARQAVAEFVGRLRVAPSVSFDQLGQPRFSFDVGLGARDIETILDDVLGLLAELGSTRPVALVLDELQAITRLGGGLADVLKGLADRYPSVPLVLAGSRRHLMEALVIEAHAPLYGMAQRLSLGPIPLPTMTEHLCRRAASGAKQLDDPTARLIVELAGPVPNDIQHLAFEAYELAAARIDTSTVDAALARAVAHEAALHAEHLARLSPGQARVLVAIAEHSPAQPYGASFVRAVGLANASSVRKALQPLLDDEDVVLRDGLMAVGDPFFAAWLRDGPPGAC